MSDGEEEAGRVDRLLDAIDLIKENRRDDALTLLRDLIREDNNFEAAWLWMAVAVETLDQSAVCLDNVLRINPGNSDAAASLYRIRAPEMQLERERNTLRFYRDLATGGMWLLVMVLLVAGFATLMLMSASP